MNTRWEAQGRTLKKRAGADFAARVSKLERRGRLDVVLIVGIVSSLTILAASYFFLINVGDRYALFDAPLIQPLADERILVNVRDDIATNPMLDAVMHKSDGRVYITQKGGFVHRYEPSTGLWSSQRPFSTTNGLLKLDLVKLRSGCGSDPLSNRAKDCPDPESLWAINTNGGLARRFKGDWEVAIGDTAFIGTDETPVEGDELTAAAVSPDNRWLVVGTKDNGVGIYNIERRLWVPSGAVSGALSSQLVTHIAWWKGRFWIGGPGGLVSLETGNAAHSLVPIPSVGSKILDLDADPDGALWILEQRACEESGDSCLWLGKLQDPGREPEVLFDERNIFTTLDMADLVFAQQWGNQLVIAGDSGIFSYNAEHHTWQRFFDGRVVTALPLLDEDGFFFGYTGGIGAIDNEGRFETWPMPNEQVVKLLHGNRGDLLVLTVTGNAFSIDALGNVLPVFRPGSTALDPGRFTSAADLGNAVLFVGPTGALLHNVSTREYRDIPPQWLPDWLLDPEVQLVGSGNHVYALTPSRKGVTVHALPKYRVAEADFSTNVPPGSVLGPVQHVRDWSGQGIGLIAGDGRVYHFTPRGQEALTGAAVPAMDYPDFLDVAALDQGLVVLTEKGLSHYDGESRAWSNVFGPSKDDRLVEVDTFGGYILARTGRGRLLRFINEDRPAQSMIGDETSFAITDSGLSDARSVAQGLYLAGEGQIEHYDLDLRRLTDRWDLPTEGPVELKGVVNELPLAKSDHTATLGAKTIDAQAGPVISLFADRGYVWTVRENDGQRFLKQYPLDWAHTPKARRCFFRNPSTDSAVTQILDARSLPDGTIVVATDAGLLFYDAKARSWFAGPPGLMPEGGRLYVVDQHLVHLKDRGENDLRVSFVPVDSIEIPHSCSTDQVSLPKDVITFTVRAVSIDEQSGRLAWLRDDGAVVERRLDENQEWDDRTILPPPKQGPVPTTLRRVYHRPDYLLFTTDRSIWRYDLNKHWWSQIALNFDSSAGPIVDINIEERDGQETVVAHSKAGEFYLGQFWSFASSVKMRHIYTPPDASFGASAEALLDVQDGHLWTFVLDDRIKYFDPRQREWLTDARFASPDRSRSYHLALGREVVVGHEGRVWWVAQDLGLASSRFARYEREADEITALDGEGTIWKLARDGTLWQCPAPGDSGEDYVCRQYSPQPFLLNRRDVRRAFPWQDLILFETDQGLRAFEPVSGREVVLPPEAERFAGIEMARTVGSQIWLYSRDRLLVLSKTRVNDVEAAVYIGEGELIHERNVHDALLVALTVMLLACLLVAVIASKMASKKWKKISKLASVGVAVLALLLAGFLFAHRVWVGYRGLIRNDWPRLRKNSVRLQDGRWAYDPITALSPNRQGTLIAVRPSQEVRLATEGTVQLEHPPALDSGWLKWDRSQDSFTVASTTGWIAIPKDEFIVDNHLLFEPVDAVLAESDERLHVANQHGIWLFNSANLGLDDETLTFQPTQLQTPIVAAHGRFLTDGGDLFIGEDHIRPAEPWFRVSLGDVTILEQMQRREINATIALGRATTSAFGDQGFTWDLNRRGLAYSEDGLLLQSDAGIHPVRAFAGFDPGPNDLARQEGTLHSEAGSGVFLYHDGTWHRRDPAGWVVGIKDPTLNRTLIDNTTWTWTLQDGKLDVKLPDPSHNFTLSQSKSGYSFSSDRLLDAAVHHDQLYVMTEAFLEIADLPDEIGILSALRLPPSPTDGLEEISFPDGSAALFRRHRGTVSRWDPISQQFVTVGASDNPYRRCLLIETDRLRFTTYPDRVVKELRVEDVPGSERWVSFDFVDGRFPFDVVTSVAGRGNELYVGTAAGLQVYSDSPTTRFDDIDHIYHLGGQTGGALVAISQAGVPQDDPDLVMARSHTGCIEQRAGGAFAPCRDPSLLDWQLLAETDLWQWTATPGGSVIGRYKDVHGNLAPGKVSIVQGRFPHDDIEDVVVCNGHAFSMWKSGWITAYPDDTIRLSPGLQTHVLAHVHPRQFICVEHKVPLTAANLSPGLYFEERDGRVWHFSGISWVEVTAPELVSGLLDHADRPHIVNRERFRLLPPQGGEGYRFEWRALDGQWQPLPWQSGQVAVDQWRELISLNDRLWAATPVGLVAFSRDATGQVVLDADAVIVIREPVDQQGLCKITDLGIENKIALARCDADRNKVFQGHLDGRRDVGVFRPFRGADPFAERELVSQEATGYWRWRLIGREGGNPGSVVGTLGQEEIHLVGGRFDFDTVHSIALFESDLLEIGTEAGGWFRAPRASLHVRDLQRPRVAQIKPATVTEVSITRVGEEQRLCLRESRGDYVRLGHNGPPERIENCPEYLGDDGFWRYAKDGQLLSITTPSSSGGTAVRHLGAGRFTDNVVVGLPVTGEGAEGVFYLLPTQAGVLHLNGQLKNVGIYVPPLAGLPNDSVPNVLFMLDPESPVYAGQDSFYRLGSVRQLAVEIKSDAPHNAVLQAIEDGPQDFVRLRWVREGERGWSLIGRSDSVPLARNSLLVNLSDFDRFKERRNEWRDRGPWIELRFNPDGIGVSPPGSNQSFRIDFPTGFDLITPILFRERLLLIGEQELMDVNLEQVMLGILSLPSEAPTSDLLH